MKEKNKRTESVFYEIEQATDVKIQQTITPFLHLNNLTIATSESVTTGLLQAAIGKHSGASKHYVGGATAYNLQLKSKLFGIDYDHANSCNCISSRVAEEMAKGALSLFMSDVAVATTGYCEPGALNEFGPAIAYFAVALKYNGNVIVESGEVNVESLSTHEITTPRELCQKIIANSAISLLESVIINLTKNSINSQQDA
ncbi:CinA family protein [Psychromonas sp. SP041]|uniref:CinA family protein n=1 Tax=Psychromonas sp. SP041 TaxID=1365007 RepID=UPI0010C7E03B|nr:CinA family protein [Psychromonas sp. SP041]